MTALDAFGCKDSEKLVKSKTNFKLFVVDSSCLGKGKNIGFFGFPQKRICADSALQTTTFPQRFDHEKFSLSILSICRIENILGGHLPEGNDLTDVRGILSSAEMLRQKCKETAQHQEGLLDFE